MMLDFLAPHAWWIALAAVVFLVAVYLRGMTR